MAESGAILVIGPAWVGDMVMAQSLFMRLAARSPDNPLDVMAPTWTRPLLQRMPQVRAALPMPLGHGQVRLGERWRLGRGLRNQYARAIVLPNSLKSALIPFAARIPRRTGFVGEWRYGLLNDARKLDPHALPKTVLRFLHLADAPGAPPPEDIPRPALRVSKASVAEALDTHGLRIADGPILALCPGAEYGPAKRWPAAHFAAVARHHLQLGGQVWLFGSAQDCLVTADIIEQVGAASERCRDLAGKTTLGQAIDLLSVADQVISNDSGLMHVAAALDRPLVALYGSSDPVFTPPLHERAEILRLGLACSPCFRRECPLGHTDCLRRLRPDAVIARLVHG